MASFLGIVSLGAHSIALAVNTFLFVSFPFAVGNGASILIGNSVGEGKAVEAKRSCHVSLALSYIVILTLVAVLLIWREELAGLFSSDEECSNNGWHIPWYWTSKVALEYKSIWLVDISHANCRMFSF
eukprot:scaffold27887_cov64-Cyclotella_meneghiniana.AAC.6